MTLRGLILLMLSGVSSHAMACPDLPFNETWTNAGTVAWTGTSPACRLSASVPNTGLSTSAAIAHYRRHDPAAPLRLSFRINLPAGVTFNALRSTTLAKGIGRSVPMEGPSQAQLFSVALFGNATATRPVLGFSAACAQSPWGSCSTTVASEFSSFPLRVTIEWTLGDGAAGALRYWVGENTSGSPTGTIANLDNSRWQGIERVLMGLADVTSGMQISLGGQPVVLDQVEISGESGMFWSDFDSSDAGNVTPTSAMEINSTGMIINGTTCGGSTAVPQIANGAFNLAGPAAIYRKPPNINYMQFRVTSSAATMGVFVCPPDGGPASACLRAGDSGSPSGAVLLLPGESIDEHRVVVAAIGGGQGSNICGEFTLQVSGTLGF